MILTPEQFDKLATKEDLNKLRCVFLDMKEMFNQIMAKINEIAKDIEEIRNAQALNIAAHDRFETRISRLENK